MSSPPPLMSKETTSALIAKFQTLIPGIENLFKVNATGKDMRTENGKRLSITPLRNKSTYENY